MTDLKFDPYTAVVTLPPTCAGCVYWEFPDEFRKHPANETGIELKKQWLREQRDTISGGFVVYYGTTAVGFCHFAVHPFFPNVSDYECRPPSSDSLFIACLYVPDAERQGNGIGSTLRNVVEQEALRRGLAAVETFARAESANNCSGPLSFWTKAGYHIVRQTGEFALVRKSVI